MTQQFNRIKQKQHRHRSNSCAVFLCRVMSVTTFKLIKISPALKETIHYCITDQNLIKASIPEFYTKYKLLNEDS